MRTGDASVAGAPGGNGLGVSVTDLRVLLGVPSIRAEYGGPAVTVPGLAQALSENGLQTGILTKEFGGHSQVEIGEPRVRQVPAKASVRQFDRVIQNFFGGKGSPDIIHDNGIWVPFNHRIARVARRSKIPRVVGSCGMLEPWALRQSRWKKRLAWLTYQKRDLQSADVIHARTEQEALNIRELKLGKPIAVVTNGIFLPNKPFENNKSPKRHIRTALFLSRIHPKKGLLNLIEAWRKIQPEGWELIIAGPDEDGHLNRVQKAAEQAGISAQVRFWGPAYGEGKEWLFREADLFILPTFSENFGVAVAEALGWGVPVITTKGAPWGIIKETNCGWWVDPKVESLEDAIGQATSLPDRDREAMGERGRGLAEREFSWQRSAEQMLEVYRWVLGEGQRPDCVI